MTETDNTASNFDIDEDETNSDVDVLPFNKKSVNESEYATQSNTLERLNQKQMLQE